MLNTIHEKVGALVSALPYLAGIPVLTERVGDIEAGIEQRLAKKGYLGLGGKVGLAVLVLTPRIVPQDNHRRNFTLRMDFTVSVIEDVKTNMGDTGHKIPALDAVEEIIAGLWWKNWDPDMQEDDPANRHVLHFEEVARVPDPKGRLIFNVDFKTEVSSGVTNSSS